MSWWKSRSQTTLPAVRCDRDSAWSVERSHKKTHDRRAACPRRSPARWVRRMRLEATGLQPFARAATGRPEFRRIPVPMPRPSRAWLVLQNCKKALSRLPHQRANATPAPSASSRQARWIEPVGEREPVIDAQEGQQEDNYSNCRRDAARSESTMLQISAREKKKMASTTGEIQKISLETCIIGPHRAQLSL